MGHVQKTCRLGQKDEEMVQWIPLSIGEIENKELNISDVDKFCGENKTREDREWWRYGGNMHVIFKNAVRKDLTVKATSEESPGVRV